MIPSNRNPVTGDGVSEKNVPSPRPRDRNPIIDSPYRNEAEDQGFKNVKNFRGNFNRPSSARTVSSYDSIPKGGYRANPALSKENLNKLQQSKVPDPRAIAASALGNQNIISRIREKVVQRGGTNGIKSLARLLQIMDDNGDKKLSRDEFKYGLRDYGIDLSPTELEQVFLEVDRDKNGFIDVTEFLVAIKGDMNARRKKMVGLAFNSLDKDKSGEITVDELIGIYDFTSDPEVKSGKKTIQQASRDFMKQWDRLNCDGIVTLSEFEDYYKEISASIDEDDYFELMIRNAWRIAGGEGAAANTANKRVLITNKDGSQQVVTVNNELGMKQGKDQAAMADIRKRLGQQGVEASNIELFGGMDNLDKPKSNKPQQGTPREAWGAQKNAQSSNAKSNPYDKNNNNNNNNNNYNNNSVSNSSVFDPSEMLRRLLYNPIPNIEGLAKNLQVSAAANSPRVSKSAFSARISVLDKNLSRAQIDLMWKIIDPKSENLIEFEKIYEILSNKFGKDKSSSKSGSVMERVVAKILERCGGGGIKGLQRYPYIFFS